MLCCCYSFFLSCGSIKFPDLNVSLGQTHLAQCCWFFNPPPEDKNTPDCPAVCGQQVHELTGSCDEDDDEDEVVFVCRAGWMCARTRFYSRRPSWKCSGSMQNVQRSWEMYRNVTKYFWRNKWTKTEALVCFYCLCSSWDPKRVLTSLIYISKHCVWTFTS